MKKILFAIFAVAALAFTGCENKGIDIMSLDVNQLDNTEYTCWKFTVERSGFCDGTMYSWDTEANVVLVLQEIIKLVKTRLLLVMSALLLMTRMVANRKMIFNN